MAAHSRILAWRIRGQRSLLGCSPWDLKESNATDLSLQFTYYTLGHLELSLQLTSCTLGHLETASLLFLHASLQVHYHFCFKDGKRK